MKAEAARLRLRFADARLPTPPEDAWCFPLMASTVEVTCDIGVDACSAGSGCLFGPHFRIKSARQAHQGQQMGKRAVAFGLSSHQAGTLPRRLYICFWARNQWRPLPKVGPQAVRRPGGC